MSKKKDYKKLYLASEKKLKVEKKRAKGLETKLAQKSVVEALEYRQKGYSWKKIGKKIGVSESSIRHRTQRHFTDRKTGKINPVLKGRMTMHKRDGIKVMHERVTDLLKREGLPHMKADVMDYVRAHRS